MLLLLLLLAGAAAALQCYNASGLPVTSVYGVFCDYCNLEGYLVSAGVCACYAPNLDPWCRPFPAAPQVTVTSTCGGGFCHDQEQCVLSQPPVLCAECGLGGYITAQSFCQCYSPDADPNSGCAIVDDQAFVYSFNQTVNNASCTCFASWLQGWFAGAGCGQCLLPALGPPPNEALLDYECNTYGGQDPDVNATAGFSICWGHGTWDAAAHNCTCDPTWRPVDTGLQGIGGVEVRRLRRAGRLCRPGPSAMN